ncbi:MAG: ImuA family protein [Phycisphaerae bacterium]
MAAVGMPAWAIGPRPETKWHGIVRPLAASAGTAAARCAVARRLLAEREARAGDVRKYHCIPTGLTALDEALGGGLPQGTLCEIAAAEGVGALSLALTAAWTTAAGGRHVFLIDLRREFYPPAAVRMGVELSQLVIVRPKRWSEAVWAMTQALRCGSVGAVVGLLDSVNPRAARQLQLAVEAGGGVGFLVERGIRKTTTKFAAIRMVVEVEENEVVKPRAPSRGQSRRRVRVRLVKARLGMSIKPFVMELGDAASDVCVPVVSGNEPARPQDREISPHRRAVG